MNKYFFLLLLAAGVPARAGILVHGHRGTRGLRPENTLPAFEEAIRVGADVIELDMHATKDDKIVISHNHMIPAELCLAPGGKKLDSEPIIRSLTFDEVRSYDCGTLPNPRFPRQVHVPGTKMPTLDEVFELAERSTYPGAKTLQFNIETKIVPGHPELAPEPEAFVALVAPIIERHHMASRVILESFDDRTLIAMRKRLPKVRLALLTSDNHLDFVAAAKSCHCEIISPDQDWITKDDIARLHKIGVQVVPWTVNEEKDWARMIDIGADAIISDYPEDLIAYLKKRGLR